MPLELDATAWQAELAHRFELAFPAIQRVTVDRLAPIREAGGGSLYRFRVRWQEPEGAGRADLALRVYPDESGRPECVREVAALRAAAGNVPAPALWLVGVDHPQPFLAFDLVGGESFGLAWRRRRADATPEVIGELFADLHDRTSRPDARTAQEHLRGLAADVRGRAAAGRHRGVAGALERLWSSRPSPVPASLCHGAFRPEHVLLDERGRPTLIEWQLAEPGDPRLDVARASLWLILGYGGALRTPFLRVYRRTRPLPPEELAWFEGIAGLERALELTPADEPERRAALEAWLAERVGVPVELSVAGQTHLDAPPAAAHVVPPDPTL